MLTSMFLSIVRISFNCWFVTGSFVRAVNFSLLFFTQSMYTVKFHIEVLVWHLKNRYLPICRYIQTTLEILPTGDWLMVIFRKPSDIHTQATHCSFCTFAIKELTKDSATWYSIHTCSMLRGSTLKNMFPYKFFTLVLSHNNGPER
jgi:hypothetical protein